MRCRILAFALAAAAAATVTPATAAPALYFERACKGTVDTQCYSDFCGIADCVRRDCVVYSGALGDGNTALCVGQARPRDPVE